MNQHLFSYGTLQREDVQLRLFGRLLYGSPDALTGHKLVRVEIKDPAFLAQGENSWQLTISASANPADSVEGTVFDMSGEELSWADTYEPAGYERLEVKLRSGKRAWVYALSEQS